MATLTAAQYARFAKPVPDGWHFDREAYFVSSKKQLAKKVVLDDNGAYLGATLYFREVVIGYRGTKTYYIYCNVMLWTPTGKTFGSTGLGAYTKISNELFTKRDYKALCKAAANITNADIVNFYRRDRYRDGVILAESPTLESMGY